MHITQLIQYKHTRSVIFRELRYVIHIGTGRETFQVFNILPLVSFPAYELIFLQLYLYATIAFNFLDTL